MRHHLLKATVMAAALMSATAFAQTSAPPTSTPDPLPKTTPAEKVAPPASLNITEQKQGQWRSSKLIGLNVYNATDEKVGDISEILIDQTGKINAVVVGVGGFLGIGQHDVAVPFDEVRFIEEPAKRASATPAVPPAAPAAPGVAPTDRTATTGSITSNSNSSAAVVMPRAYPDHAVLNMTREQLKAAPPFKYGR